MNELIKNILKSKLSDSKKKSLIDYSEQLIERKLPVLLDVKALTLLFNLEFNKEIKNVQEFVRHNTIYYQINKKSGEKRQVHSPNYELKSIQKWILNNVLEKIKISDYSHGFIKGRSIITNASTHVHDDPSWMLTIDIRNFFDSISIEKVKIIFLELGYNEKVSDFLAELCTFDGKLAQGFPTSPYISNIYMKEIDEAIVKKMPNDINYSRYADDMSFSGIKKEKYSKKIKCLKDIVYSELLNHGLTTNKNKYRLQKRDTKFITGLMIRKGKLTISNNYLKEIYQEIYYCKKFGVLDHLKHQNKTNISNFKGYMYGKAMFVNSIDKVQGKKLVKELNKIDWI